MLEDLEDLEVWPELVVPMELEKRTAGSTQPLV